MADRPNQFNGYPMIPNNFSMNLLQQQQQQQQMQQLVQQQQQNALNQARGIPGMSNSENQQMWQQLQLQHRSQMGGMDSMGNQEWPRYVRCSPSSCIIYSAFLCAFAVHWRSLGTPDPWRSANPNAPYAEIAAMTSYFPRPPIARPLLQVAAPYTSFCSFKASTSRSDHFLHI